MKEKMEQTEAYLLAAEKKNITKERWTLEYERLVESCDSVRADYYATVASTIAIKKTKEKEFALYFSRLQALEKETEVFTEEIKEILNDYTFSERVGNTIYAPFKAIGSFFKRSK